MMNGRFFLTAAALLLAAGCAKQDLGSAYRSDPDAVRISAQVGGDEVSGGFVTTRSVPVGKNSEAEEAFKSGDRISVTADGQKKVVYTLADDGSWNPEAGKYLKWTSRTMTFSACYPAADGVSTERFTVPADQSDADKIESSDYMTFSASIDRAAEHNGVTLAMTRKMVRIVVEPAIQNQFGVEYYISELKVHGNRKGYSGGNPVDGEVAVKAYKHTDGKFYALLPPTTEAADAAFIDVTVTKDGVSETLQAKGIPATTAGNSYTVSLTVGKNVASVKGVSVSPWNTSSYITGGEAVLVPYITFTAEAEQTFKMDFDKFTLGDGEYFEYSVNGGKWVQFTSTVSDVAFGGTKGNLRLRGQSIKGTATNVFDHSTISFANPTKVSCTGDIRTLIDYENYADAHTAKARFYGLFWGCNVLTTAPDLPAKELASNCYGFMFYHCQALTEAPELPATTLAYMCYEEMFDSCISLTKAPILPAENLTDCCYQNMFYNCINLSSVTIKATDVSADKCLLNCLTNAGTSTASRRLTVASDEVYTAMVSNGYVPDLWKKADKYDLSDNEIGAELADIPYITFSAESEQKFKIDFSGYRDNFTLGLGEYFEYSVGGDKWVRFTGTVSDVAFGGAGNDLRLRGKSSNGTAMNSSKYSTISFGNATEVTCTGDIRTLIDYKGYNTTASTDNARFCSLFKGCSQLTTAPDLLATTLASYCYYYMFYGCTALTTAPSDLLAATLPEYCYYSMFGNCSNLTTAPIIHANVMQGEFCCNGMFNGCASLTTVQDELPAMTLSKYCYYGMFQACSSLTKAPKLPATILATDCYHSMFSGCTKLNEAPELPAETLVQSCYWDMFSNCSKLSSVTMKATDVPANNLCLRNWLFAAGTDATSRTLTLANESIYNTLSTLSTDQYYLPDNWKKDVEGGATVIFIDSTSSTGE